MEENKIYYEISDFIEYSSNGKTRIKDFDDYLIGYSKERNGTYKTLTATESRHFKTEKGAQRYLEKKGFKKIKNKPVKSFKDLEQRKFKTKTPKKRNTKKPAVILPFEIDQDAIDNSAEGMSIFRPYRRTRSGKIIFAKDYGKKAFRLD